MHQPTAPAETPASRRPPGRATHTTNRQCTPRGLDAGGRARTRCAHGGSRDQGEQTMAHQRSASRSQTQGASRPTGRMLTTDRCLIQFPYAQDGSNTRDARGTVCATRGQRRRSRARLHEKERHACAIALSLRSQRDQARQLDDTRQHQSLYRRDRPPCDLIYATRS